MNVFQNLEKIRSIPVIQIEPNRSQPRRCFSKEELQGLSDSIKENGLLHPLSVRRVFASKFELISGERRLRASIMAGFKTVPCVVLDCDEIQAEIFALLENLQRSELLFFDEAEAIYRIIQYGGITQEIIAKKLGKKQSTIANKLRLLKLNKKQRQRIMNANLTERHARALLRLENEEQQDEALNKIILNDLNVIETETLIEETLNKSSDRSVKVLVESLS